MIASWSIVPGRKSAGSRFARKSRRAGCALRRKRQVKTMYELLNIRSVDEAEYADCYALMSSEKKAHVDAFRFADDRKRSVCAELLARRMLSARCGVDEREIVFAAGSRGKPYAVNVNAEFSVSHSGDYVLCAVGDRPTGADIEKMRAVDDRLVRYVCTDAEAQYVCSARSAREKEERFFTVWTAKEAYFKARGTGITGLKSVCVLDKEIRARTESFIFKNEYAVSIYTE